MRTSLGVKVGLSVLAFVAATVVLYFIKTTAQVSVINGSSMACSDAAKAHPSDRLAMDRCLKARGVLVEDSSRPEHRGTPTPVPVNFNGDCLRAPSVVRHKPKTSAWALELSACLQAAGRTAVVTMRRNPATGEIEYGVAQ